MNTGKKPLFLIHLLIAFAAILLSGTLSASISSSCNSSKFFNTKQKVTTPKLISEQAILVSPIEIITGNALTVCNKKLNVFTPLLTIRFSVKAEIAYAQYSSKRQNYFSSTPVYIAHRRLII